MELEKVIALIQAVSDSALTGLILDEGNLHLELQKVSGSVEQKVKGTEISSISSNKMPIDVTPIQSDPVKMVEPISTEIKTAVCSPLVGTFYRAPAEGEAPFVQVGDRVTKGQVLGIIEAMKLMNEIECEQDGVISEILVENGEMVEYGQKLFLIQ